MNKIECKKYLRRAYKKLKNHNKSITPGNIEDEMREVIKKQSIEYIAYVKIAVANMQESGNSCITLEDLLEEIEVLPAIYNELEAIEKAKNL